MKKVIDRKLGYTFDWHYKNSIEEIEADIKKMKSLGATHVDIEYGTDEYDCDYIFFKAIQNGLETDEEYKKRIEFNESIQERKKKRDLELLESLKSKYEQ